MRSHTIPRLNMSTAQMSIGSKVENQARTGVVIQSTSNQKCEWTKQNKYGCLTFRSPSNITWCVARIEKEWMPSHSYINGAICTWLLIHVLVLLVELSQNGMLQIVFYFTDATAARCPGVCSKFRAHTFHAVQLASKFRAALMFNFSPHVKCRRVDASRKTIVNRVIATIVVKETR